MKIISVEQLRAIYGEPSPRSINKEIGKLDELCKKFISLSPFLVLGTTGKDGSVDASPRGGEKGFVKVDSNGYMYIPDANGNRRLDSLINIVETRAVGILFFIPGFDETLRVNGVATISVAEDDLLRFPGGKSKVKSVIVVEVSCAYIHCAKAFMRSRIWDSNSVVARSVFPTISEVINVHSGIHAEPESKEAMEKRYLVDL